jgi:hypothetical protein
MGVLSLGDDLPVWAGGGRIIYSIIGYAISLVGEKPYLTNVKENFDHGYNHADLSGSTCDELSEFRYAAANYTHLCQWKLEGLGDCEDSMQQLLGLIDTRLKQIMVH